MISGLDRLQWLALLVWVAVLVLFLCSIAVVFFASRTFRVHVGAVWFRHRQSRSTIRPTLLTVAVAIVCALLLQISSNETLAMRLSLMVVGAGVTWISFDWGWKQAAAFALHRAEETRLWRERAFAACSELEKLFESKAIQEAACRLLREALDCHHVYLFLPSSGSYVLATSDPLPPETDVSFAVTSLLEQELTTGFTFRAVPVASASAQRPLTWSRGHESRLEAEQSMLHSLQAEVVIPMQRQTELTGFFILGPRMDESAYGVPQLRLAEEVARQTAASLVVATHSQTAFEQATELAHEQASRRTARATRTHLAPPDRFEIPGLDFSAQYWQGDSPGGAFYDIVGLPNRAAAFFLADIPGPAEETAVRLVQLQALLRSRAWAYNEDLPELLESTQRALALSAANRPPISIFCARYVARSRKLQYVNAGHLPPFVVRQTAEGAEVTRLTAGGPPLGVLTDSPRIEGEVGLQRGDVVAVPSAGVLATPSPAGDLWGESRLISTILQVQTQKSVEVSNNTLRAADEFSEKSTAVPPRVLLVMRAT
jgi:sigma-B regulation protein RsbU (phosphoserine phosphatase)